MYTYKHVTTRPSKRDPNKPVRKIEYTGFGIIDNNYSKEAYRPDYSYDTIWITNNTPWYKHFQEYVKQNPDKFTLLFSYNNGNANGSKLDVYMKFKSMGPKARKPRNAATYTINRPCACCGVLPILGRSHLSVVYGYKLYYGPTKSILDYQLEFFKIISPKYLEINGISYFLPSNIYNRYYLECVRSAGPHSWDTLIRHIISKKSKLASAIKEWKIKFDLDDNFIRK